MASIFQSVSPAGTATNCQEGWCVGGSTFIDESQCPQHLHLADLPPLPHSLSYLTHIQRVIVTLGLCIRIHMARILPSLLAHSTSHTVTHTHTHTHLRKGSVVPYIPVVRKAVIHESHFALFHILHYWVQWLRDFDLHAQTENCLLLVLVYLPPFLHLSSVVSRPAC